MVFVGDEEISRRMLFMVKLKGVMVQESERKAETEMSSSSLGDHMNLRVFDNYWKWCESMGELTKAILKFGERYEAAQNAKLQQMVEISQLSQLAWKNGRVQEKNNHHHLGIHFVVVIR
ncbi:hypothetical protein Droror1_Dr00027606 [Drosera rotundifolia]